MIVTEGSFEDKWRELWQRSEAQGDPQPPFEQLMTLFYERQRHYHTRNHVAACLMQFHNVALKGALPKNKEAIEYAIWYHDAIYDPKKSDNEELSAKLAIDVLSKAQLPVSLINEVERLILMTAHHNPGENIDELIMADVDLSILGAEPGSYGYYKRGIRNEYSHVPLYLYRKGRIGVLEGFLQRLEAGELFHLPVSQKNYKENAFSNMRREINELKTLKVAIYAGSFDPPTNGHLHIIDRSRSLFDNLVVGIGQNADKPSGRFKIEDRLEMLREITNGMGNVDITSYPQQYLINFAKEVGAGYVVRGLRSEKDWDSESTIDEFGYGVHPEVTTIFLRTPDALSRISSSFVMGLVDSDPNWQEAVKERVPEAVFQRILMKGQVYF